jgi:hypothetical protein
MSRQIRLRRPETSFTGKAADLRSYGDASGLANWLNLPGPSLRPYQEQTAKLIELLRQVSGSDAGTLRPQIEALLLPAAACPWKLVPRLRTKGWFAAQHWPPEHHGLMLAARLSAHGLDWVRQCSCGKWFVAYNRRNSSCSRECRQAFDAQQRKTPDAREQLRVYMRKYRLSMKKLKIKPRRKR